MRAACTATSPTRVPRLNQTELRLAVHLLTRAGWAAVDIAAQLRIGKSTAQHHRSRPAPPVPLPDIAAAPSARLQQDQARRGTAMTVRFSRERAWIVELVEAGRSWSTIGATLGISARAAHDRYRRHVRAAALPAGPAGPRSPALLRRV